MTICPPYPYKLDVLNKYGIATKSDLQFGASWIANDSNVTPQQFYEEFTLNVDEVIEDVDIYAEAVIDGKNSFLIR